MFNGNTLGLKEEYQPKSHKPTNQPDRKYEVETEEITMKQAKHKEDNKEKNMFGEVGYYKEVLG